jgi:hypothetical protein
VKPERQVLLSASMTGRAHGPACICLHDLLDAARRIKLIPAFAGVTWDADGAFKRSVAIRAAVIA